MTYERFIEMHRTLLTDYWNHIAPRLVEWKSSYEWPPGVSLAESVSRRNRLEDALQNDLQSKGWITKKVFDEVMMWGFRRASNNSEDEIGTATKEAFSHLSQKQIADAALSLTRLPSIGISRASKVLALSNQSELGIYDSRAAHGVSDLTENGRRLIPIPPGRAIKGDSRSSEDFCKAYEQYIWVLTFFRERALSDDKLRGHFVRVSDLEIAFFARSRAEAGRQNNHQFPAHIRGDVELDEGDCYWTLGYGDRAKPFWAYVDEQGITVLTGLEGRTALHLTSNEIELCLTHFRSADWFPLGNTVDAVKPNGLGEYFKYTLKVSAKFASHFAKILADQGRLDFRYGKHNAIELKVSQKAFETVNSNERG